MREIAILKAKWQFAVAFGLALVMRHWVAMIHETRSMIGDRFPHCKTVLHTAGMLITSSVGVIIK